MPGPTRGVRPCSSSVRRSPATGRTVSPARPAAGLSVLIPAPWRPEPSAHTPNLERIGLPVVVVDVRPVALVHADVEPVAAGLDVEAVDGERDRPRPGQRAEPNRVALGRQVENARPVGDPVERHPDDRFLDRDVRGSQVDFDAHRHLAGGASRPDLLRASRARPRSRPRVSRSGCPRSSGSACARQPSASSATERRSVSTRIARLYASKTSSGSPCACIRPRASQTARPHSSANLALVV